jgi:AmmeMemoRadiSam system protein A
MDEIKAHLENQNSNDRLSKPAKLAKEAIETYVREGRVISPGQDLPDYMLNQRGAAFVCIKKGSSLRGCIGTTEPVMPNLAEEIIRNAIESARRDPRFPAVEPRELSDLSYTVDVLGKPEQIPDTSYLDPKEYGIIVESGFRRGLLLPDIDGVDTSETQVVIARQKAGIGSSEPVTLYRFTVTRFQ